MHTVTVSLLVVALLLPTAAADDTAPGPDDVPCVVVTLSPPDAYLTEPCVLLPVGDEGEALPRP